MACPARHHHLLHDVLSRIVRSWDLDDTAAIDDADAAESAAALTAEVLAADPVDPRALIALGWFHWSRYQAGKQRDRSALQASTDFLVPCFLTGAEPLPDPLRPLLADLAMSAISDRTPAHSPGQAADTMLWRRILEATPVRHPHRARRLLGLGISVLHQFVATEDLADIDEAIAAFGRAVGAAADEVDADYLAPLGFEPAAPAPADPAILRAAALNLTTALGHRASSTDTSVDIADAVLTTLAATRSENQTADLSELAMVFASALADVDEPASSKTTLTTAINLLEHAAAHTRQPAVRTRCLTRLSSTLLDRYNIGRDSADLERALSAGYEALNNSSAPEQLWVDAAATVVEAHLVAFQRTRATTHLDDAVALARTVLALPSGDQHAVGQTVIAAHLAEALHRRYETERADADLDDAIALWQSPATAPSTTLQRSWHAHKLSSALLDRFDRDQQPDDLRLAVDAAYEAADTLPEAHPDRGWHLTLLGIALRARYRADGADHDRLAAGDAFAAAVHCEAAPAAVRIGAARPAAALLTTAAERVADLLETAVGLLDAAIPDDITPADQQHIMSDFLSLSSDAAAAILEYDRGRTGAERAARVLELGRTVLLRKRTGAAAAHPTPDRVTPAALTAAQLRAAADEGPIVVVNVARQRCDALLVQTGGVSALALTTLTRSALIAQLLIFYRAIYNSSDDRLTLADRRAAQVTIHEVLEWLWDHVAESILDELDLRGPPADGRWPRLWWAPGGLLGLLPLHAAGYHRRGTEPGARTVLDRVVSSYTTTVAALLAVRGHDTPGAADGALVVAMPHTPGQAPLSHARTEARIVADLLADVECCLDGDTTTHAVVAALQRFTIVHLACHTTIDADDPSNSRLLLADHQRDPLTVARLCQLRLHRCGLVYLSACETAFAVSVRLLDESIHLAAAMQASGCPQIVATLWLVNDELGVDVAAHFYRNLTIANRETVDPGAPRRHFTPRCASSARNAPRCPRCGRPTPTPALRPKLHAPSALGGDCLAIMT